MSDSQPGISALVHPPETKTPCESIADREDGRPPDTCFGHTGIHDQELSQVFRHSGWAGHRRTVYKSLIRTNQSVSRIIGFADCGRCAYVLQSPEPPVRYRVAGSSCHDRFCNPCATERARTIAQNVIDRIGTERVRFITFTLRHTTEPLVDLLRKLYESFRRMQRTRLWKEGVKGGVAFLEVKWNRDSDSWHPHLHCLVQGRFIERQRLQDTWLLITGDSFVVDIRLPGGAEGVARYVTKYASKPLSTTFLYCPQRLDEAMHALRRRRLCMTFGSWRGMKLLDKVAEEGWTNIGPLSDWLARAKLGDVTACAVLLQIDALKAGACLALTPIVEPRPPPQAPLSREQHPAFWNLASPCF